MAVTRVNTTASGDFGTASASSMTFSVPAPTAGNTLVLAFDGGNASLGVSSIAQTGVTWTKTGSSSTLRRAEIWTAVNIGSGAGTSITINFTTTLAQAVSAEVFEYAGLGAGTVIAGTGNSGTSTTPTTSSVTPTAGRAGVVVAVSRLGGNYSAGPTNGFTGYNQDAPAGARGYSADLLLSSASGSYATGWTAASGNWETYIAAIVAPAGGNTAPTPTIAFPADNNWRDYQGASITFTGSATDAEDGTIPGGSLAWSSSINGALGTGVSLTVNTLSTGTHTITLTATDSGGLTGTATRTVTIGPALGAGAQFVTRKVAVPSTRGGFWGTDPSTEYYWLFLPKSTALAAKGWTTPYRVQVALHGSGENGSDNLAQMTGSGNMAQRLGFGASAAASVPDVNWPTIVAFPQRKSTWTGDAGPSGGTLSERLFMQAIDALLTATYTEFSCDQTRTILNGLSAGAYVGFAMAYQYPSLFAGFVSCAGYISSSWINGIPGINDANDTASAARVAPALAGLPIWMLNSQSDATTTPALYNVTKSAFTSLGPPATFHFYESTTYDHVTTWTKAYADDGSGNWSPSLASGTLWSAVWAAQRSGGADPNPTPPAASNRHRRARRVAGVLL